MGYKKFVWFSLSLSFLGVITLALMNYMIDPLQFYRKAWYDPPYHKNQRLQMPGFIKHYEYNTIILGTSVTENFVPSYIDQKLGFKTLKLSMRGASLREQTLLAETASMTGKVKNIIWGIDLTAASGDKEKGIAESEGFPMHMYDSNLVNDAKYLINGDIAVFSMRALPAILRRIPNNTSRLDTLYNWNSDFKYGKDLVVADYEQSKKGISNLKNYTGNFYEDNLEHNVVSHVLNHPEINYYIFFPPYSILFNKQFYDESPNSIEDWIAAKKYLLSRISRLSNVQIYDFQDAYEVCYNLDLYKDTMHYSGEVNRFIVDQIKEGNFLLNLDNFEYRATEFLGRVKIYTPPR